MCLQFSYWSFFMGTKFCPSTFFSAVKQHPKRDLISEIIGDIDIKFDLYMDRTEAPSFYDGHDYYGDFLFVPMWQDELAILITFLADYFGLKYQSLEESAEQILTVFLRYYTREYFPYFSCVTVVIDWTYLRSDLNIMFDVDEPLWYKMERLGLGKL